MRGRSQSKVQIILARSSQSSTSLKSTRIIIKQKKRRVCNSIGNLNSPELKPIAEPNARREQLQKVCETPSTASAHTPQSISSFKFPSKFQRRSIFKGSKGIDPSGDSAVLVQFATMEPKGHNPQSRDGGSLLLFKNILILVGGQVHFPLDSIFTFNFQSKKWKKAATSNSVPGRQAHLTFTYESSLYIYGGRSSGKKCSKKMIRLHGDSWEHVFTVGTPPAGRRNQAYCQIGRTILTYGGTDSSSKVREDLHLFDIYSSFWALVNRNNHPGPLSHATLTPVFVGRQSHSLDEAWENPDFQGCYLFGGIDSNWNAQNTLYSLQKCAETMQWNRIEASGRVPSARFGHTAESINERIYIFGGRNDGLTGDNLNDLFIFNSLNLVWEEVIISGTPPESRWGHSMAKQGETIYIFGGINYTEYQSPQMFALTTLSK